MSERKPSAPPWAGSCALAALFRSTAKQRRDKRFCLCKRAFARCPVRVRKFAPWRACCGPVSRVASLKAAKGESSLPLRRFARYKALPAAKHWMRKWQDDNEPTALVPQVRSSSRGPARAPSSCFGAGLLRRARDEFGHPELTNCGSFESEIALIRQLEPKKKEKRGLFRMARHLRQKNLNRHGAGFFDRS